MILLAILCLVFVALVLLHKCKSQPEQKVSHGQPAGAEDPTTKREPETELLSPPMPEEIEIERLVRERLQDETKWKLHFTPLVGRTQIPIAAFCVIGVRVKVLARRIFLPYLLGSDSWKYNATISIDGVEMGSVSRGFAEFAYEVIHNRVKKQEAEERVAKIKAALAKLTHG